MSRRTWAKVAAPALAAALVLSACGGGGNSGGVQGVQDQQTGKNDINPVDPASLKQGGEFRFPLDQLPDNYNRNQVDGSTIYGKYVLDGAVLPSLFTAKPDNTVEMNKDYLEAAELTSQDPQVVTFTINPKAAWYDGTPITWEDFKAQAEALNGKNQAFSISSSTGYEDIAKVEKGKDDRQVVVTFGKKFAEWKSLFSPLYPKSTNSNPATFNTGWSTQVLTSAGPFKVDKIDETAKTIILVRNEKWWGAKPVLDKVIFRAVARNALADALASNEIDFYEIGSSIDLYQRAKATQSAKIRVAVEPKYSFAAFNGAPSSVLADVKLRQAVQKAVDPNVITQAMVGQMTTSAKPLGNHILMQATKYYKDNSGPYVNRKDEARAELDALGYKLDGPVRKKDGKPLEIRYVLDSGNPISDKLSKLFQDQLKEVGVTVKLEAVSQQDFFKQYVNVGNFDISGFALSQTAFPISSSKSVYALDNNNVQQNYGRVGNDTINKLFDEANAELDEDKRAALANKIDEEIWKAGHQLLNYQYPGAVAVRDTVANFGAWGFQDIDYTKIGFTK